MACTARQKHFLDQYAACTSGNGNAHQRQPNKDQDYGEHRDLHEVAKPPEMSTAIGRFTLT